jgi:hypothetical protein
MVLVVQNFNFTTNNQKVSKSEQLLRKDQRGIPMYNSLDQDFRALLLLLVYLSLSFFLSFSVLVQKNIIIVTC